MNTEITDTNSRTPLVLYDGQCPFCLGFVRRFERSLLSRGFKLLPLQTPWVRGRLGLSESELLAEMKLLLPDGTIFGGADAVVEMSRGYWWTFPLRALAKLPGGRSFMRATYRWVARHRFWFSGRCDAGECNPAHRRHRAFFEMP